MERKHPVCFAAGQSGGHLLPALALAATLRQSGNASEIILFSGATALDRSIMSTAQIVDKHYVLGIKHLTSWYRYPGAVFALAKAFFQSLWKLKVTGTRHIISTGGLIAVPVCLAGWLLGIPVTLYELNAIPGRAIAFLARFATHLCICFDTARSSFAHVDGEKISKVDYPLRFREAEKIPQTEARYHLGIPAQAKVLLILGGSQGSHFLNTFAQSYLRYRMLMLSQEPLVVFHQAGQQEKDAVEKFYTDYGIAATVFSYTSSIERYYAAADTVIARAGAGTLFELAFFGKKSIIIPLEHAATGHQVHNAYASAAQQPTLFTVYRQDSIDKNPQDVYRYLDSVL